MLRITRVADDDSHVILRVEGQVVSHWVAELERETKHLLQSERRVILDFSDVNYVDTQGANMLKRIAIDNIEIINCSAMIKDLLGG